MKGLWGLWVCTKNLTLCWTELRWEERYLTEIATRLWWNWRDCNGGKKRDGKSPPESQPGMVPGDLRQKVLLRLTQWKENYLEGELRRPTGKRKAGSAFSFGRGPQEWRNVCSDCIWLVLTISNHPRSLRRATPVGFLPLSIHSFFYPAESWTQDLTHARQVLYDSYLYPVLFLFGGKVTQGSPEAMIVFSLLSI